MWCDGLQLDVSSCVVCDVFFKTSPSVSILAQRNGSLCAKHKCTMASHCFLRVTTHLYYRLKPSRTADTGVVFVWNTCITNLSFLDSCRRRWHATETVRATRQRLHRSAAQTVVTTSRLATPAVNWSLVLTTKRLLICMLALSLPHCFLKLLQFYICISRNMPGYNFVSPVVTFA